MTPRQGVNDFPLIKEEWGIRTGFVCPVRVCAQNVCSKRWVEGEFHGIKCQSIGLLSLTRT